MCGASLDLPRLTRCLKYLQIGVRDPIITHRQSDCCNNGRLIILAKAEKNQPRYTLKHGSWRNFHS
ncbi:Uncharacterized protein DAT39_016432, partial [Clarias magur]